MQVHTLDFSPQRQQMHHVHTKINREESPPLILTLKNKEIDAKLSSPQILPHHVNYLGTNKARSHPTPVQLYLHGIISRPHAQQK
jgi:hypothetical protein